LAEKRFTGNLLTILSELDTFLKGRFTQRPIEISTLQEKLIYDFPPNAVRELLMNAVLHRDYQSTSPIRLYQFDNRIEIQNPGGLYGDATPENFPRVNSYRNPILAEVMHNLGYVNRFGRGVAKAKKALLENGSAEPIFQFEPNHFLATIHKHPDR
jgi:ATP-dependent DNA helicase RecG